VIVFLRGPDQVAIRRRMQQLRDEADGGSVMLSTNLTVLDGRDAKPAEILGAALTPPFLAPKRLVVVDNLIDRLQRRPARGGDSPDGDGDAQPAVRGLAAFDGLVAAANRGELPPTTILVFTGESTGPNALGEKLKGAPGFSDEVYPELKPAQLPRYISDEAAIRGVRFRSGRAKDAPPEAADWLDASSSADPVALLAALTQGDTLRIASELDKLALFAQGQDVTTAMVLNVCSGQREVDNFKLADAILDGEVATAVDVLHRLMTGSTESGQGLIGMLAGRYRQLAALVELLDAGAPVEEVSKALGRAGTFPRLRDAAVRRARRLGEAGVRQAIDAIVTADRHVKMGEMDEDVAIELLVVNLAILSRRGVAAVRR
jgi:DNA polymerase-3 subunit delta